MPINRAAGEKEGSDAFPFFPLRRVREAEVHLRECLPLFSLLRTPVVLCCCCCQAEAEAAHTLDRRKKKEKQRWREGVSHTEGEQQQQKVCVFMCVKQRLDGFLSSSGTPQALIHLFKPDRRQHAKRILQRQSSVSIASLPFSLSLTLSQSVSVCL